MALLTSVSKEWTLAVAGKTAIMSSVLHRFAGIFCLGSFKLHIIRHSLLNTASAEIQSLPCKPAMVVPSTESSNEMWLRLHRIRLQTLIIENSAYMYLSFKYFETPVQRYKSTLYEPSFHSIIIGSHLKKTFSQLFVKVRVKPSKRKVIVDKGKRQYR